MDSLRTTAIVSFTQSTVLGPAEPSPAGSLLEILNFKSHLGLSESEYSCSQDPRWPVCTVQFEIPCCRGEKRDMAEEGRSPNQIFLCWTRNELQVGSDTTLPSSRWGCLYFLLQDISGYLYVLYKYSENVYFLSESGNVLFLCFIYACLNISFHVCTCMCT